MKKRSAKASRAQSGRLRGTVTTAGNGFHGFDTDSQLTQGHAAAFREMGFQFCIRYLSRSTPQAGGDLSPEEAQAILEGGLSLMAVQHVMKPGWVPTVALGAQFGAAAATNAQGIGLPPGVTVWLDLEGVRSGVETEDVIGYCNAWFDSVAGVGYEPGIYVGSNCALNGDELFWRLRTKHYWRSGSSVPDVPHRGYQLVQRISPERDSVNGVEIDRDLCTPDILGGAATWLAPA